MSDFARHPQSFAEKWPTAAELIRQADIDSLDELFNVIRDHEADLELRTAACDVLGKLAYRAAEYGVDRRRALPPLLIALKSPKSDLRIESVLAIGRLRNRRAIKSLLQVAQEDPIGSVRLEAIRAVGIFQDERALPPLLALAQDKNADQMERIFAIIAVHDIGDKSVIPHLKAIMLDAADDVKIRAEAAEWLSHMVDNTDTLPAYITFLQDDAVQLRFWAAFGLVTMSWMDISEALMAVDQTVAHDTAILPGWWTISREAVPALENTWYKRFSVCTDDSCCCRTRTYLISSLFEYWDYLEKSRCTIEDQLLYVPFEQQTDLIVDPIWLSDQLTKRWPTVRVDVRQPKPKALLLDWLIDMENGLVLGGLHRDGQCIFLTGDEHDVATIAVWYRTIISEQHVLRLYDWADPGREIHSEMTPEQLVLALHDYSDYDR